MARQAATPTSRKESEFRKMQSEFAAVETLVQKGRLNRDELLSSAQEMFDFAVEQYQAGHAPFRAHAAEWSGNVAALAWLAENQEIVATPDAAIETPTETATAPATNGKNRK